MHPPLFSGNVRHAQIESEPAVICFVLFVCLSDIVHSPLFSGNVCVCVCEMHDLQVVLMSKFFFF